MPNGVGRGTTPAPPWSAAGDDVPTEFDCFPVPALFDRTASGLRLGLKLGDALVGRDQLGGLLARQTGDKPGQAAHPAPPQ